MPDRQPRARRPHDREGPQNRPPLHHCKTPPRLRGSAPPRRHTFVRPHQAFSRRKSAITEVLSVVMEIDVVLPCLNEAGALPWVLSRMPNGYRPIVADNGSTDDSAAVAAAYGARVVHVPQRGFGAACHAGLLAASSDIVCVMDADASFDPGDLPAGGGSGSSGRGRPDAGPARHPGQGRLAAARPDRQPRPGRRAPPPDRRPRPRPGPHAGRPAGDLLALALEDRRFGYPLEMVVRAAEAGWRIQETAVPYYPRTGKSKVTGTVRGTARAVRDMRRVLASITPAPKPAATPNRAATPTRETGRDQQPPSPRRPPHDRRTDCQADHRDDRRADRRRRTAEVYTGRHRREGAAPRHPPPRPPGARPAACCRRRSW